MKFNNPKVLADALSDLDIQPNPNIPIEIQDTVVPTIIVASNSQTAVLTVGGVKLTNLHGTRGTAGTTTLGTVPAGKVWKIYAWEVYCEAGLTGSKLNLGSILTAQTYVGQATAVGFVTPATLAISLSPNYVELTATETVTLVTAAAGNAYANIFYSEEDA